MLPVKLTSFSLVVLLKLHILHTIFKLYVNYMVLKWLGSEFNNDPNITCKIKILKHQLCHLYLAIGSVTTSKHSIKMPQKLFCVRACLNGYLTCVIIYYNSCFILSQIDTLVNCGQPHTKCLLLLNNCCII